MVEQGKDQGVINPNLSGEVVRMYIQALQGLLAQPGLSRQARLEIDEMFFYGLWGKDNAVS